MLGGKSERSGLIFRQSRGGQNGLWAELDGNAAEICLACTIEIEMEQRCRRLIDGGFEIVEVCEAGIVGARQDVARQERGGLRGPTRYEFENQYANTAGAESDGTNDDSEAQARCVAIEEGLNDAAGNRERNAAGDNHRVYA